MIFRRLFPLLFLVLSMLQALAQKDIRTKDLVLKTLNHVKEVKGLKYHLKVVERGRKGMNYYESTVKFHRHPRLIYLYIKGIEVLWLQGKNNGKALVKPNSFPFFNLNLDPMGSLMRQDQHHTLNEMGFDYFASIIQNTVDKLGPRFDDYFELVGEERMNNRPCYKVVINNRDFQWVDYKIGAGESITSIARKFFVPEYLILEKNPHFNDYFDILEPGKIIKIPTWYARRVTMFIDQLYYLPISVKVEDDKGLFEEYNYHHLQVNPKFEEGEFTRDFPGYGF